MDVKIIHMESNTDRLVNIKRLQTIFKDSIIVQAIVPNWIKDAGMRSVLGCSLSHLNTIRNSKAGSVLILEDDAYLREEFINYFDKLSIPNDAAIIVFGGDIPRESILNTNIDSFYQIDGQFYGSHAVWYNLNLLNSTKFFEIAYGVIANSKIGTETESPSDGIGLCYESILSVTMKNLGLKYYRPKNMPFSTIECISNRTTRIMESRDLYMDI